MEPEHGFVQQAKRGVQHHDRTNAERRLLMAPCGDSCRGLYPRGRGSCPPPPGFGDLVQCGGGATSPSQRWALRLLQVPLRDLRPDPPASELVY